jgi:ABC-type nitrate/sulfonate/bicarbonate transport system substrate-binding protein
MLKKTGVLLIALGMFVGGVYGIAAGKDLEQLRVTIPVRAIAFYPLFVAHDQGFFADEGYKFEIISTQGDGPDVDALIAKSVEFCVTPPHRALAAYEQGKKLLLVANLMNRVGINVFMNKEVAREIGITRDTPLSEKMKKLKGLTLGCTRPGSFTYNQAVHYLKRTGYIPQKDAKVVGAGGVSAMVAAVENRKVDLGLIGSPGPETAVHRGKSIMWVNNQQGEDPEYAEFLFETLYVRPEYAKENPEIVRGVVRALVRAMYFIKLAPDHKHFPILRKYWSGVDDKPLKECLVNMRAAIRPDGRITKKSVDANVRFLKETGLLKTDVPWTAVATNEFLPK